MKYLSVIFLCFCLSLDGRVERFIRSQEEYRVCWESPYCLAVLSWRSTQHWGDKDVRRVMKRPLNNYKMVSFVLQLIDII